MPTRAAHWRQRHLAVGRKGAYEASFLDQDDEIIQVPPSAVIKASDTPSSPISVASTFELLPEMKEMKSIALPDSVASTFDLLPEVKPIALPDQWVTVGKNGKPIKMQKMYDEPEAPLVTKKAKKKRRTRRTAEEASPTVVALEETGSSSIHAFDRSTAQRFKEMIRSQDAKHWAKYQRAKQTKREALELLVAALTGDETVQTMPPMKPATKDHKANSNKDKARRRARSAAAAARCFSHEPEEDVEERTPKATEEPTARKAKPRGELQLLFGSRASLADGTIWTTVGKGGKALSDFPPLKPPTEQSTKRRKSGEAPPQKAAKHEKGKSKCVMM